MKHLQWNNLLLAVYVFNVKYSWEMSFLKAEIKKFWKLLKISCWQVMKSKMTIIPWCLTCFTHPCLLCRGVFKKYFGYGRCYFMYTRHLQRWKNRRPCLLSTRTYHNDTLMYIQAIHHIYRTDYMSLITVHISYAPPICWQQ